MELNLYQIFLVGLVASALVQGLRLIGANFNVRFSKAVIGWISAGVSLVLAVYFLLDQLPALVGDPMELITALVTYVGVIVGMATLIYNIVFDKLFDVLGVTVAKVLKRK
jgi:hypothetical protein